MKGWKDEVALCWTLRDIDAGRLPLPISEDQLQELLDAGLAKVTDGKVALTETGAKRIY